MNPNNNPAPSSPLPPGALNGGNGDQPQLPEGHYPVLPEDRALFIKYGEKLEKMLIALCKEEGDVQIKHLIGAIDYVVLRMESRKTLVTNHLLGTERDLINKANAELKHEAQKLTEKAKAFNEKQRNFQTESTYSSLINKTVQFGLDKLVDVPFSESEPEVVPDPGSARPTDTSSIGEKMPDGSIKLNKEALK